MIQWYSMIRIEWYRVTFNVIKFIIELNWEIAKGENSRWPLAISYCRDQIALQQLALLLLKGVFDVNTWLTAVLRVPGLIHTHYVAFTVTSGQSFHLRTEYIAPRAIVVLCTLSRQPEAHVKL